MFLNNFFIWVFENELLPYHQLSHVMTVYILCLFRILKQRFINVYSIEYNVEFIILIIYSRLYPYYVFSLNDIKCNHLSLNVTQILAKFLHYLFCLVSYFYSISGFITCLKTTFNRKRIFSGNTWRTNLLYHIFIFP